MAAAYDDSGRADQTYGNTGPGAKLNTISFVGVIFGFLLIVNRLFWRWKKGTPGIDDVIIVFAWLTLLGLGVVTFIAVDYGYGRHNASLTRGEASDALRMFYLYQIFYKLTLNLSKLSILTLYLRVFDTKDWFGYITKFLIVIVSTYTTSIILANIFICRPISTYWSTSGAVPHQTPNNSGNNTNTHPPGSCINILAYYYASSLYNILSETLMLLSVLLRIWTLPSHSHPPILQFRQKINLTIVLGLGVFTVITAILRMTTLNQTAMATDRTGGTLTSTIWSSVEAGLGLAVANLPMVRQLLRWRGWCGGGWFRSSAEKSRSRSRSWGRGGGRNGSAGVVGGLGGRGGEGYMAARQCLGGRERTKSRNASASAAGMCGGIGLRTGSSASHTDAYTHGDTHLSPSLSSHRIAEARQHQHRNRDPERQTTSTISDDIDGDVDIDIDVDGYTSDIDSIRPLQLQHQHQGQQVSTPRSPNISTNTSKTTNSTTTTVHNDARNSSLSDTPTPSITSTSISTLRSPTEPVPMVRISTEPRGNVGTHTNTAATIARECPSPPPPTLATVSSTAANNKSQLLAKDMR